MSLSTVLYRSLRLRCPRCGQGKLFRGRFSMHATCDGCEYQYDRGPGYFLGSIYVNYGLTSVLVVVGYFTLFFTGWLPRGALLWTLGGFSILFPLWFFRYARSLWIGFDQYFDPVPMPTDRDAKREPTA